MHLVGDGFVCPTTILAPFTAGSNEVFLLLRWGIWAQQYDLTFDMLEILIALSYAFYEERPEGWYWVPLGAYEYRHQNRARILEGMEGSIASLQDGSPYVKSGIFGKSATECLQKIDDFKRFVSSLRPF